ncbi:MAG TPA: hypothetical protein VIA18_19960 [Polyangia bacterium]|nr:hypothetical protein [Polyangia bacterium]
MRVASLSLGLLGVVCAGCQPNVVAPPGTSNIAVALYDPLASPPVLPSPNDLAFAGGDGVHLNVPDEPGQSPAQLALNAYLRTLTGFPPSSTASTTFSAPLDPTSLTVQTATAPGSIIVVDTTTSTLATGLTASLSSDGKTLTVADGDRFSSGHRYAALLFGNGDALGLKGADGAVVLASSTFFILLSPTPLLVRCADATNPACTCPAAAIADASDTTCHSSFSGLTDAQARQAEPQREALDAALTQLLPAVAPGRDRDDVVLFWTFTITPQPVAEFDPTSNAIPFPNDVLIDQSTGNVALPIAAGDPEAALKMEINTLDGFSESAAITLPVDVVAGATVDAASLVPGLTTLLVSLDPSSSAEAPVFVAAPSFGQVALVPTLPLASDQTRYAAVVTRGATASGVDFVPSPATALILQANPLFDGTHSTVSVLDDASAQQLEALRLSLAPLLVVLQAKGLSASAIAALWTFTTQSIARPLAALDAFPTTAALSTDVTATVYTDFSTLPVALQALVANVRAVVLGTFTTQLVYDPTTRLVHFTRTPSATMPTTPAADSFTVTPAATLPATVHYWLTLPKTASATGAPVVIAQHGLTSWRGDVFVLANDLAASGSAAIGFDIDFHGARTRCSADSQCTGATAGSCDMTTGVCATGLAVDTTNPLACDLAAFSGDMADDCEPAASGNGYVDPANLFGGRAGGFQYVVDASQLVRVVSATGGNSLQARLTTAGLGGAIDATHLSFVGHSLGAINGAVFLATDPSINGANVLSVGGGHVFEILSDGDFHPAIDQLLQELGITRGTAAYAQLVQTARWVLDPTDPFSVGRLIRRAPSFSYVLGATNPPKLAIVQEAGMDTTVPPQYEAALSLSLWGGSGVDGAGNAQGANAAGTFVSTFFSDAVHTTLLTEMPSPSMRTQATTYVLSGGATLPVATP